MFACVSKVGHVYLLFVPTWSDMSNYPLSYSRTWTSRFGQGICSDKAESLPFKHLENDHRFPLYHAAIHTRFESLNPVHFLGGPKNILPGGCQFQVLTLDEMDQTVSHLRHLYPGVWHVLVPAYQGIILLVSSDISSPTNYKIFLFCLHPGVLFFWGRHLQNWSKDWSKKNKKKNI